MDKLSVKLVLAMLSIEAQSCSWSQCNDGCASFVSVTGHLTAPASDVSGETVTLCWNSRCSSGTVGAVVSNGPTYTTMGGSFAAQVVLNSEGAGSSIRAEITGGDGFVDGDNYELSVIDSGGTVVYSMSRTTTYTVEGSCDTRCSIAMIDL